MDRIREKQLETKRGTGGKYFKAIAGKNIIRVYKFSHLVTADDVKKGYFKKSELGKVIEELDRPVIRHFNVSKRPVISNAKLMAEYTRLKASANPADQSRADQIKPSRSYFLNVVNIDKLGEGMLPYAAPASVYNGILAFIQDPDYGEEILGGQGRDIVIMYDPKAAGATMYRVVPRKEGLSQELPEGLKATDLYLAEAYEQMGEVQDESDEEEAEEEDSEEDEDIEERPKRSIGTVRADADSIKKAAAQEREGQSIEDEVKEIFEDEDEEEVEPIKKKKKLKR